MAYRPAGSSAQEAPFLEGGRRQRPVAAGQSTRGRRGPGVGVAAPGPRAGAAGAEPGRQRNLPRGGLAGTPLVAWPAGRLGMRRFQIFLGGRG